MKEVELLPHQEKAIGDMHNGCVLTGDVGSGKSLTALAYALKKEPGRDIYVITTAKKRDSTDWIKEAAKLNIPVEKIMVDSWNNIKHYQKVYGAMFIFDEQRLVGTGAWVKAFYDIARKNRWILLSATPGDTWLDYVPVFIANGFYKNITEFRQQHVIYSRYSKYPKVERYLNPGLLQRRRKLVIVEMPMERHTTRHIHMVECDYDQERFDVVWKKRWNVYEGEPIKDAGELFRVGRKVVATHSSRLQKVRELMEKHPKLIVFYNFDYELEMLRSLVGPSGSGRKTTRTDAVTNDASLDVVQTGSPLSTAQIAESHCLSKSDPLKGTVWEKGWDEEAAFRRALTSGGTESGTPSKSPFEPSQEMSSSSLCERQTSEPSSESSSSFALAEWNGHNHDPIPETDRWVYLVQYTAGAEGWNCIDTDAMVFWSLTYSYKQFYQSQGRIDRMNTPYSDLHYYVLVSKSPVEKAVWRALKMKKDFNLRGFRL